MSDPRGILIVFHLTILIAQMWALYFSVRDDNRCANIIWVILVVCLICLDVALQRWWLVAMWTVVTLLYIPYLRRSN